MDSITHTLFGLTIYGANNKEKMPSKVKKSIFVATVAGSLVPDLDVISQFWDTNGLYQMWHRGITHSLFLAPLWAAMVWLLCYGLWKTKDRRIFFLALLSVFIHITSDLLNTWGTGYFEPFSSVRLSIGTIPIIDFVIWVIMLIGYLVIRIKKAPPHKIFKMVWAVIVIHVLIQSIQGYMVYESTVKNYEKQVLTASFIPWHFGIVGKNGGEIEILQSTIWSKPVLVQKFTSKEEVSLEPLFRENPKAKTLYEWSPFVVVVDDEKRLGIFDPRFYRNGESFLNEYIEKDSIK